MRITLVGSRDRLLEDMLRPLATQLSAANSLGGVTTRAAAGEHPNVIVLDIRDQPGIPPDLATLRRVLPDVSVVVVAAKLDPATMLDAMRSGVNEFLTEPVDAEAVRAAIERVSTLRPVARQAKSYAFIGAKGGGGTTTVAVNVATALAKTDTGPVLMVDLHPAHGDAALFFGVESRFSVIDALENTHRLDDAFMKGLVVRTKTGLDLLASSDRSMVTALDSHRVRTLLEFLFRSYAHVVLDVPRSESAVLDALEGVTHIVIVANQELPTVRGASRLASSLRQRYGKDRVEVVVSRYDTASEIGHEDVERVTGGAVKHVFPSNYRLAVDALNRGGRVVAENHNKLAASYVGFARSLAGVPKPVAPAADKPTGLFGRLTGRRSS